MAPKRKKADGGMDDTGQKCRVGFKDAEALATSLGPHVNERFFTFYTTSRSQKDIEKKKLTSKRTASN